MKRPPRIVAASFAGHLFRVVPYRSRLAAALRLARLVPFAKRWRSPFEHENDARARVLVRTMTYANVPFPNDIVLVGAEELRGPAIIVSAHIFLNALLLRALVERGHRLAIPRTYPADPPWLAGSSIPLENLLISPTILVTLRRRLAGGEIAFINVDGAPQPTPWEVHGLYLSDAAVAFAKKIDVPLFFASTRVHGGKVISELRRAHGLSVDQVMEELKDFLTVAPAH